VRSDSSEELRILPLSEDGGQTVKQYLKHAEDDASESELAENFLRTRPIPKELPRENLDNSKHWI